MALSVRKFARYLAAFHILALVLFLACACSDQPYIVQIVYEPPSPEETPIAVENRGRMSDRLVSLPVENDRAQPQETPLFASPDQPQVTTKANDPPQSKPSILPTRTPAPTVWLLFTPRPTPIPLPTNTPVPTPTHTPLASPTPTPTPTISPTASPTASSTPDPKKMIEDEYRRHEAALKDIDAKYDREMLLLMNLIENLERTRDTSLTDAEAIQLEIDSLVNQINELEIPRADEIALEDARHAEALAAYGG